MEREPVERTICKTEGLVGHSRHQKGICQLFNRNADAIRFIAQKSKFYSDGNLWKLQRKDLHFAFNASLAAVNVAKVIIKEYYPTFSMANLKSLLYNAYIMNRFFAMSGFRPNVAETECKAKLD